MVKIRYIFILLLIAGLSATAQTDKTGVLKFNLGLGQSYMNQNAGKPLFLDGYLEYFPENRISIKGSCNQSLAERNEARTFDNYTGILFGAFYHFGSGISDFAVGLQPGVVLMRPGFELFQVELTNSITPSMTASTVYTLHFSKHFNFYLSASYNRVLYRGADHGSIDFSNVMLSGGLAYQIRLFK
ncbi:MAG: hypothetical protein C0592_00695 [Marinilabiliales bacterium]|nr:MAG: hypothetical protein C0592_00695 [Marinilabiliales bacterium]